MNYITNLANQYDTPLLLFSEIEFRKSYMAIKTYLPNVKHHYALKPLPFAECIETIASCDGYLDIASIGELERVKKVDVAMLKRAIYTHPIKKQADIFKAYEYGIDTFVAENLEELQKFLPIKDKVKILIRLAFPNTEALCNLSERYGADTTMFEELVEFATLNNINIIGCCFHVGSQMSLPNEHIKAIKKCRKLYDWVFENYGIKFSVLDIGGGFPASYDTHTQDLAAFCKPINEALAQYFPETEVWSEPGRCIAANAMILVTQVVGKVLKEGKIWYYLDDGLYGTYSGMMYEPINYKLYATKAADQKPVISVFCGPTCDSVDIVAKDILFQELAIGDYLFSIRIGAYSHTNQTKFNLIKPANVIKYDFDLSKLETEIKELHQMSNLESNFA
jgi:ornithine decarboxylase